MKRILLVVVCCLLLTGAEQRPPSVEAPNSDPKTANYVIFPVTTELQRKEIFDEKTKVYLLVNGSAAIIDDKTIRADAVDFYKLFREVGYNSVLYDGEQNSLQADSLYKGPVKNAVSAVFENALEGVGRRSFKHVEVVTHEEIRGIRTWEIALDALKEFGSPKGKVAEDGVGDGLVKAYPIRTALSRYHFHYPGVDCVLALVTPFDRKWDGKLSAAQEKSVLDGVAKLKLAKRDTVVFSMKCTDEGIETFVKDTSARLTKTLGFKNRSVTTRPYVPSR